MAVFLFLKQIVDMLYQYQILDYGMVIFGVVLLVVKVWRDKIYLRIKDFVCAADWVVAAVMLVCLGAFLRFPSAYGVFFKIESSFLLYFLGRVYGEEIMRHGRLLAYAGYAVVYSNFFYRFYQFGFKFIVTGPEETLLNAGGLYYYKTDLAVGIIIAVLFIYFFGKKSWLKWLTIFPICGYMVFYSGARMQQAVMSVEYLLILLYEIENRTHFILKIKEKYIKGIIVTVFISVFLFFLLLQLVPFEEITMSLQSENGAGKVWETLMHSRHLIWWDILEYFSEQSFGTRLFGIDLQTEYLHTATGMRAHSTYIKLIYSTGYIGCFLVLILAALILLKLCKKENRKLVHILLGLWVMLLGSGLTIESMEATQMSWFPMLFTGILFSEKQVEGQTEQTA